MEITLERPPKLHIKRLTPHLTIPSLSLFAFVSCGSIDTCIDYFTVATDGDRVITGDPTSLKTSGNVEVPHPRQNKRHMHRPIHGPSAHLHSIESCMYGRLSRSFKTAGSALSRHLLLQHPIGFVSSVLTQGFICRVAPRSRPRQSFVFRMSE